MAGLSEKAHAEPPGLMSQLLQTTKLEERNRGTPGARKEPQNPYPDSIRSTHTVELRALPVYTLDPQGSIVRDIFG